MTNQELKDLKVAILAHKKTDWGQKRAEVGKKGRYEEDKRQVLVRLDLIEGANADIAKWTSDIREYIPRLEALTGDKFLSKPEVPKPEKDTVMAPPGPQGVPEKRDSPLL